MPEDKIEEKVNSKMIDRKTEERMEWLTDWLTTDFRNEDFWVDFCNNSYGFAAPSFRYFSNWMT